MPQLETENRRNRAEMAALPLMDHGGRRFMEAYLNLDFGWYAAKSLAAHRQDFPCVCEGEDNMVFRAFLYNCSTRYPDQVIREVCELTTPATAPIREAIEALFLVKGATIEKVAETVGIRKEVISAYEKLFFNVIDRKADEAFLARSIYPNSRLVEMYSTYLDGEPFGEVLKRAARTSGAWDVLYMAGYTGGLLHAMPGHEITAQFESIILTNGLIMARNGWLNQQTGSMGLHHARSVLTAAKIAGQDTAPRSPMSSLGDTISSEIQTVKGELQQQQILHRVRMAKPAQVIGAPT